MVEIPNSPNWGCVPAAFSMALNIPYADLIAALGHDGSAKREDGKPVGIHIQELIDYIVLQTQFETVQIERYPYSLATIAEGVKPHYVWSFEKANERFLKYLERWSGVLGGFCQRIDNSVTGHAVYWDHVKKEIGDPRILTWYPFAQCDEHNFHPILFWPVYIER